MNNEFKIITLGDIFKNIETEEKAFKFKDYIKDIQKENERLQSIIKEVREYIEDKLIDIDTHNVYGEIERLDLEEIKRILNEGNI